MLRLSRRMSQGDSFSTSNPVVSRRPGGAAKIVPINSNKAARDLQRISNNGYNPINNSDEEEENLLDKLHKVRKESAAKSLPFSVRLSNLLAAGSPGDVKKGGARRKTRKAHHRRRHTRRRR